MAKLSARDAADGWPLLRRLWREELVQHRLALLGVLGLVAIIAAMTSLYPVLIKLAFDSFATGAGGTADPLLNSLRSWLVVVTGPGIGPIHVIALMVVVVTSLKGFALLGQIVLTNSSAADAQGILSGGSRIFQWGWTPVGGSEFFDAALTPNNLVLSVQIGTVTVTTT